MAEKQIFAFWRIAITGPADGISITFGGSEHTYEARGHCGRYWSGFDERTGISLELSKRERNNW